MAPALESRAAWVTPLILRVTSAVVCDTSWMLREISEVVCSCCDTASGRSGIRCANTSELRGAYVALGHHDRAPDPRYLELRARMMERGVSMRNFGSAALQLAHVARGRLDAFIELHDAAAALKISLT